MRSAKLERQFIGDGYYDLCLPIGQLIELQEKLGCGPSVIATRLLQGEWLVEDIQQSIRLGLIGGGMAPQEAFNLVRHSVIEGYLMDYTSIAANLLYAALSGVEDEPILGEAEAPATENPTPLDY